MDFYLPEPDAPRAVDPFQLNTFDLEIDALLGAPRARTQFQVDGSGMTVAVLDTGLRVSHRCFKDRVIKVRNFTPADGGDPDKVTDTNGHGTNVTGIIAAGTRDERRGIAPGARIVVAKTLPAPSLAPLLAALDWISNEADALGISVVNLSLGVPGINLTDDAKARSEFPTLHKRLVELNHRRIAVVVAAGNSYGAFQNEGMSMPAIFREVLSVGAVYDASVGPRDYAGDVSAFTTHADQITPLSQRLSKETSPECYTDVLSAGGAATSAGAKHDDDTSVQDGTNQAAPTVAGIVLLMQQHHKRLTGSLPRVELLQEVLRSTSTWVVDGDNEDDNVHHTKQRYASATRDVFKDDGVQELDLPLVGR
ncbi:MAG: S8 family peptidase [Hydrogenophaga sp.]